MRTKIVALIFGLFILAVLWAGAKGLPTYVDLTPFGYASGVPYATNDTITFAHTVSAGDNRLLVVAVGVVYDEPVNDVQWGDGGTAQALTRAGYAAGAGGWRTELWYLIAPTVRSDSIFIDIGSAHEGGGHAAFNFTNVLQTDPIPTVASNSAATGTEIINNITTTYDSSTVLTVNMSHGADCRPYTPSIGQVELYDTVYGSVNWDPATWGGYKNCVTAGAHPCTLTASGSDDWAILSIEIRQAGPLEYVDTCCSHTQGDTIDFGLVDTVSTRTIDWELLNCGDSTLADTASISGHPYFTITSDSIWSIGNLETAEISLAFTPTTLGVVTATVQSGEDSCGSIVLKGEGIAYTPAPSTAYYLMPPYSRGGYRAGNDTYSGTHPDTAWATLYHAESQLEAGDTLLIMGGLYTNAQQMLCSFATPGTPVDPIVVKAYGDSIARFTNSGGTSRGDKWYFSNGGNANHFVIDGCSFLTGDSLYFEFVADTLNGTGQNQGANCLIAWVHGTPNNPDSGLVIRGCEFDGSPIDGLPSYVTPETMTGPYGFWACLLLDDMTDVLVEKNYIHNINRPTGCWHDSSDTEGMWGNGYDRAQGSGEAIYMAGSNRCIVRNNTFERINHGCFAGEWTISDGDTAVAHYMILKNNRVNQRRGGHFYLSQGAHHILVENNLFMNAGQSASFPNNIDKTDSCRGKGKALQISGDDMTVRGNVFYNPQNIGGFEAGAHSGYTVRRCFVYNNTTYKGYTGSSMKISQRDYSGQNSYARNNRLFNNIWYAPDSVAFDQGASQYWECVVYFYDSEQSNTSLDWIEPNTADALPQSTHFGGHYLHNNLMARDTTAGHRSNSADYDTMIFYVGPSIMTNSRQSYSINEAETIDPLAFSNNVAGRPLLTSLDPESYGIYDGWWYPRPGSPCIDAGRRLTGDFEDTIGTYVGSVAQAPPSYFSEYGVTTYGWVDTLAWTGTAPDIGAYESPAAGEACCDVENMAFGEVPCGTTATDSFSITNCGDTTLVDSLEWDLDAAFVLVSDSAYTILGGQTEWFVVEFSPVTTTTYLDTLDGGAAECVDILFSGTGTATDPCCIIPVVLAFGYVDVTTTATDSFFIANCGDSTLVDSIEWNLLPAFVLASDSSYAITAGDTAWFTVEFTPTLAITYVDTLTTSQIQPECTTYYGGVIIGGLGDAPDTCCTVLDRAFGTVYIDSTKVDSFAIINCGEVALVDSIDWSVDSLFVLMSDSAYSIDVGDTAWFTVAFTPTSKGGRVAWQDVGHPACSSVMLSGRGRSLTDGGSTFIGTVIWQRAGTSSYSTLGVFGGTSYSGMAAAGCRIRDSDITDYWYTTSAKITWVSTSADSGHIRWDETGNTAWNYVEEAGDDSTMHYVLLNPPLVIDYVGYDYCVRTGSAGCYSEWSEVQTYYTRCGTDDVTQLIENWDGFNNRLRVDPLYKNKAQIRYKQLTPIELPWQSTYAWIGAFDGAIKTYSFGVLDPSATWAWSYRLQDPCLSTTVWIEAPDFTTDASGHIE